MNITIRRPNGDKIWEAIIGPRMNLPTMCEDEEGNLHINGLSHHPPVDPPWKIEIEPTKWATAARKEDPRSEWEVIQ